MLSMSRIRKVYRTQLVETYALRRDHPGSGGRRVRRRHGPLGLGQDHLPQRRRPARHVRAAAPTSSTARTSAASPTAQMSRIRNEKIGFIFQSFNLIPDLDVFDNVDVPLRYRGLPAKERKARIERAVEMVGLSSRLRHLPSQLSGGQQQRVAIARVLAGDPKLILADEPTGNLDSLMAREIMDLLERINEQGTTIIMVTHDPECAARAHRHIHMLDGKVVDTERRAVRRADDAEPRGGHPVGTRHAAAQHLHRLEEPQAQPDAVGADRRGIALGIAFATTFVTVRHAFTKHPLPDKEPVLRYIRLDNWDPRQAYPGDRPDALPPQITLSRRDGARALDDPRAPDGELPRPADGDPGPGRRTPDPRGRAARRGGLLRDVPGAVPVRRAMDTRSRQQARAGGRAVRDAQRTVVRRPQQRRQDAAHREPRLPHRRRAGRLAADRAHVRHDRQRAQRARSGVHAVRLVVPMEIRTRGQQRRLGHPLGHRLRRLPQLRDELAPVLGRAPVSRATTRPTARSSRATSPNRRRSAASGGR